MARIHTTAAGRVALARRVAQACSPWCADAIGRGATLLWRRPAG